MRRQSSSCLNCSLLNTPHNFLNHCQCCVQAVIFLYLLDNETSMVILASSGIGLLIEFWKITRAMDVSLDRSGSFPRLRFKDRSSYT